MPRRTSSRLRGGATPGAGCGSNNPPETETGGASGGSDDHAVLCPPLPASPGKRKARSPVEEMMEDHGGSSAPGSAVRCSSLAFQSPKKKPSADRGAAAAGVLDRLNTAPLHKENDLAGGSGSGNSGATLTAPFTFGHTGHSNGPSGFLSSGAGGGSFRLSAFSAFSSSSSSSSTSSSRDIVRRRTREDCPTPGRGGATAATAVNHASSPSNHLQFSRAHSGGGDIAKPTPLPFLLPPANITSSPDLGNKAGSRRARRTCRITRSRDSGTSSSNGSPSPALTPAARSMPWRGTARTTATGRAETADFTPIASRGRSLSGTGCAAAGGRRAATSTTTASPACAASPPPGEKSSGGGPAGACRSGGGGCDSETDQSPTCKSPIRSPVHRLTESLQKWAPGSRYKSIRGDADDVSTAVEAPVATRSGQRDRRRHNDSARSCVAGAASTSASSKITSATSAAFSGGAGRDGCAGVVASSWSGQELRRTLEQESVSSAVAGDVCQGHRRARSHTEEVMFPQDRFQDSPAYSPISPASSVGSINLAGAEDRAGDGIRGFAFGASSGGGGGATPSSAGRPWRSSPSRTRGGGIRHTADSGRSRGDVGVGTADRFAMVRMQGSWSDDEDVSADGGSSATVMRLAFSPGGGGGREAEAPSTAAEPDAKTAPAGAGCSGAGVAAVAPAVAATALPPRAWESPLSPMKGKRPGVPGVFARGVGAGAAARAAKGAASESVCSPGSSVGSPMPSRTARRGLLRSESPEDHSLQSVRDLMDEGTDEEEEGGGGHGGGGRLFRRRRRRQLPGLGLRALEMPDASADLTVVDGEGGEGRTGEGTSTSCGGSMMMMTMDDDEVTITTTHNAAAAATASPPCQNTPNPLVSPAAPDGGTCGSSKWSLNNTGGGVGGALDNSSCPTTCGRWEYQDASTDGGGAPGTLESTRIDADEGPSTLDGTWTRGRKDKGKSSATDGGEGKRVWAPSTEGFGTSSSPEGGQDVTQGSDSSNTSTNSGAALGIDGVSGLSGADTSGTSDTSTSFKSRPIPDQSAFSSTRISRAGAGAPLSPQAGGGPAIGPGPLCVTPRKSVMRCPPTPQRTPTWDGLEDSLLLEGGGSGGRSGRVGLGGAGEGVCGSGGESGGSVRRSLRSHSKLRGSSAGGDKLAGRGDGAGSGEGMVIDTGLANTSEFCSLLAEAADDEHPGAGRASTRIGGGSGTEVNEGSAASSRNHGNARTGGRLSSRARGGRRRVMAAAATKSGDDHDGSGSGGGGTGAGTGIATGSTEGASGRGGLSSRRAGEAAASGTRGEDKLGFKNDFVQMGPIGEGGFSVVWKVRAKGTGRLYAIKRSKREFRGKRDRDRCLLEARALHRLGEHPGVLRFERAWQEEGHFCLQTELCELGTLKDFLERLPTRWEIPEAAVWQVLHDVGQALRHVHATQLVHLDVKPANLLIGDEGGRLKLADFGMATGYGKGAEGSGDCQEGDTLYMAKELLSSTERLPSADMFSLGLTVYEVATRTELPGDGEDWHAMRDGRALGLPGSRSQALGDLIRQLMHPDPERRPTADGLCKHPRIAEIGRSSFQRNDFVVSQARAWRAAEAAVMKHPSNGLRTPTGDMSARYIFQQTG